MGFGTPILGWSGFASAGMLLWGLAAIAPVLIHLWMRQRYRTVRWGAMAYLLAAVRQNARRRRIEQWVLLALRTTILLLAALAWADPVWTRLPMRGGEATFASTHYVLVLDASYSMAAKRDGATRFDEARAKAGELVRSARQGDGFTLVLLSQPPKTVIGEPTFDREVVLAELQGLSIQDVGADLPATWSEVERILQRTASSHARLERQKVVVFSDLGRTTWRAVESADFQQGLRRAAERAELLVADVGRDDVANLAVTRVELRDPLVVIGRETTVEVDVRSFASQQMPRKSVELYVDGQPAGVREIDVPAAGRATVTFSPRFETSGDHTLEARLSDDDLDVDNSRWLVVPVRERIRVLCVEGRTGEARFVALALAPESAGRSRVDVETAAETALAERDLSQYDVVVLCNVARFDGAEAAALRRFTNGGGGLAIFAGDLAQPENYHQWLGPTDGAAAVAPGRLGRIGSDAGSGIDALGYRHPLVAPFRGQSQAGLLTTPVWRYWEFVSYDREQTTIAMSLPSGAPLVIDAPSGRGRCLLFVTAPSMEAVDRTAQPPTPWTALPVWPSFVPLMQESMRWLAQGDATGRTLEVGATLSGSWTGTTAGLTLEMAGPSASRQGTGEAERVSLTNVDDDATWSYQPPLRAGAYVLRGTGGSRPAVGDARWFALNVNVEESDPTRLDTEFLPSPLKKFEMHEAQEVAASLRGTRHPWFRWLLMATGGLLIVESWLAWRMGSPASAAVSAAKGGV